jgi:hypothetical protein
MKAAFSSNDNALLPAKFNQVRLDGQPDDSQGPAFAPRVITTCYEFTEGQRCPPGMDSHEES